MTPLVLGSTSRYRQELLSRLRLPFAVDAPDVDETPAPDEPAHVLARRLAQAKARAVALRHPGAWVIGSDQAASLDGQPVGKPGGREAARSQLVRASGRQLQFHTAVCLHRDGEEIAFQDLTQVRFRALENAEIDRYLDLEPAFDCAGSFKSEGLGISLFESVQSQDPTALVGLPLIALAAALRQAGYRLP
jgi:septum formation protein